MDQERITEKLQVTVKAAREIPKRRLIISLDRKDRGKIGF